MNRKRSPEVGQADIFGTYLETLRSGESRRDRVAESIAEGTDDDSQRLLTTLAESGARTLPDLARMTGWGLSRLMHVLDELSEFGLVTLPGRSGRDVVEITPMGAEMVNVLRDR